MKKVMGRTDQYFQRRGPEMIVIAKLEGTRTGTLNMAELLAQAATENDVDEIEIPDPDLLKNETPIEVVQCQVKIQKLMALNNLDMTVYHYLY
jgi:hypothetical protein